MMRTRRNTASNGCFGGPGDESATPRSGEWSHVFETPAVWRCADANRPFRAGIAFRD